MINEKDFIAKIKQYDNSGLEFEPIDSINEQVAGTMRPLKKRGMYTNEFTVINLSAFEVINEDTVLNLFNVIPPGPKEMDRRRTHLVVGRYSQAILPLVYVETSKKNYVLLQKRYPINYGYKETIEVFRDYINAGHNPDIKNYFYDVFAVLLKRADTSNIKNFGHFWESIGVMSSNVNVALLHVKMHDGIDLKSIENELNSKLENRTNIIGPRHVFFEEVATVKDKYGTLFKRSGETALNSYLNDLISITGLFWLFRYIDSKHKNNDEAIQSIVQ